MAAEPDSVHLGRGFRVVRLAILLGLGALSLSIGAGILSYRSSRAKLIESLVSLNQVLAQRMAADVDQLERSLASNEIASWSLERWREFPMINPGNFLCVIGRDGRLLAHSRRPEMVGMVLADVVIPQHAYGTVGELIRSKSGWSGENVSAGGGRQLAAYSYSETLGGLFVVHTPEDAYQPHVRTTALPWSLGFGLSSLILWPICLVFAQNTFRKLYAWLGDAHDEIRNRLNELEHVYRTMPVGLCLMDTELRFLRINEQMAEITGVPIDQHLGRHLCDVMPNIPESVEAIYREVIATGEARLNVDVLRRSSAESKSVTYYRFSCHPLWDVKAKVIGVSTVIQDITAERYSQNARQQKQAELADMSRLAMMEELVTGIAHEINQPLSAISNLASATRRTLRNRKLEFPVKSWLQEIEEQAIRGGKIIHRLRTLASKRDDRCEKLNLVEVIRDAVSMVSDEAQRQGIDLSCRFTKPAVEVVGSQIQLKQVFVNLLKNACDAVAGAEAPSVKVQLTGDGEFTVATIEDNGKGIPPEQRPRLFDAFVTSKQDGLGLGLAISRSIIEAHSGNLSLDPAFKRGARFEVSLPTWSAN